MIEPTITGCLRNPRRNCQCGLGERRAFLPTARLDRFKVRAVEVRMKAP
jgi:hypothetical protein